MKKNVGRTDKAVRLTAAAIIVVLIAAGIVRGWLAVILGILAGIAVVVSVAGRCPLYIPLGVSTLKKKGGIEPPEAKPGA